MPKSSYITATPWSLVIDSMLWFMCPPPPSLAPLNEPYSSPLQNQKKKKKRRGKIVFVKYFAGAKSMRTSKE